MPVPPFRRVRRTLCLAAGLSALATFGGCAKPLLTPTEERSQYDRYDAIRGQRSPAYTYDEFGTRRPNLRGRLMPKE